MANLFVGRLSKSTRQRDVEDIFSAYGRLTRCDVKYGTGMAYAFVDFQYRKDAEDAMRYENDREVDGQRIVVEYSRGPKNRSFQTDDQCYNCGKRGHFARDCRDGGRSSYGSRRSSYSSRDRGSRRYSRSRSRSRSRDRHRSRSRSRDRRRSRSTDRSKSRSRSPADKRSPSKSPRKSRSKSPRKSRSKSPRKSRSKSPRKSRSKSPRKSRSKSRDRSRSPSKERNEGNSSPAKDGSPPKPSQETESSEGQNGHEESTT